ncbi:MAG: NCS2 family permease [candidate division Zixibacteria bacterium]|nr:NCS2 family permease [candidate division Zixibacteria bacterium]
MKKFFEFDKLGTTYKNEILGGLTTFFAMAYIIIVNPAILANAGIPRDACITGTIIAAIIGTLIMALYAKRPFAIAPYMGENAFIAFTVCLGMGYNWEKALGAVFIGGVIFVIITALRIRSWLVNAIPLALKQSFAVGIGFFIMFIGLNETGIIRLGIEAAPVKVGQLSSASPILAIVCVIIICILMIRKVPGAILIGMLTTTILAFIVKAAPMPSELVSLPPSVSPVLFKIDILGALSPDFLSVILVVFILDFVDTMGTLIGVSARAGLLDENYNLPEIEKPMMADAVATVAGSLAGTSTTGTFIESSTGIEAGAKSGFASLVTTIMFCLCLFLSPIFVSVPPAAYGAALIVVGFLMLSPIKDIHFNDYSELFPSAATIALMSFTYNIGFGMAAGFVLYPLFKVCAGKRDELNGGVWVMFVIAILLFVFYPYGKI